MNIDYELALSITLGLLLWSVVKQIDLAIKTTYFLVSITQGEKNSMS